MLKLTYFANPFGLTFTLKLDFPSSTIVRWSHNFLGFGMQQEFYDSN